MRIALRKSNEIGCGGRDFQEMTGQHNDPTTPSSGAAGVDLPRGADKQRSIIDRIVHQLANSTMRVFQTREPLIPCGSSGIELVFPSVGVVASGCQCIAKW
jgi:hypothetical protein